MRNSTLSVKEMSEILGISLDKAYQITRVSGFPVINIGGRRLVSTEDLKTWLENSHGLTFVARAGGGCGYYEQH